jgi:hypothetical protein
VRGLANTIRSVVSNKRRVHRRARAPRLGCLLAAAVAALAVAAFATALPVSGDGGSPLRHVTMFGDSVATGLYWQPANVILSAGIDLDLRAIACQRTEGDSCNIGNGRPVTVLDDAASLGQAIGPTVIMAGGYDDYADQFAQDIADALAAFSSAGVKQVFWLTLREAHHPYIDMNGYLQAAAAQNPQLIVLDWNMYSRSHDDWVQPDGLHLTPDGAIAMATFIHSALVDHGIAAVLAAPAAQTTVATTTTAPVAQTAPVRVATGRLPAAVRGKPYRAWLAAKGGHPPYRWARISTLPHGIVFASDGLVAGIPRAAPGAFTLIVKVTDAAGEHALRRVLLRVSG